MTTKKITEVRKHFYSDPAFYGQWIVDILIEANAVSGYVLPDGTPGQVYGYDSKGEAEAAEALYLAKNVSRDLGIETSAGKPTWGIRTFDTGAIRDTVDGKLNYIRTLSPLVMERYVKYIGEHRVQPDGSLRDWGNWKKGVPQEVYLEGQDRHHRAVWKLIQGYPAFDNHGPVTLQDSLCGVLFNAIGMLHDILEEELECGKTK